MKSADLVDEYVYAFTNVRLSDFDTAMLKAQYNAPAHTVTVPQLASLLGYQNFQPINGLYGKLGHRIADILGTPAPQVYDNGEPCWFSYLSWGEGDTTGFQWIMYPAVVEALEILGIVTPNASSLREISLPEEIDADTILLEGATTQITVNSYERNPKARRECIDNYGLRCQVCEIDFEEVYGEIGRGYIQVHHKIPLGNIGESYIIDPIEELIPLCPNCHAMIHRQKPPFTIEELKSKFQSRKWDRKH